MKGERTSPCPSFILALALIFFNLNLKNVVFYTKYLLLFFQSIEVIHGKKSVRESSFWQLTVGSGVWVYLQRFGNVK